MHNFQSSTCARRGKSPMSRSLKSECLQNLSSSMWGLTLALAAVGLYGILSYSVGRRTTEIGVRMALGAKQSSVVAMVLRESFVPVATGIALGVPVALVIARAASNVLSDVLFAIRPADPLNLFFAIATMAAVAFLAALHQRVARPGSIQ